MFRLLTCPFLYNYSFADYNPNSFVCEHDIFNLTCGTNNIISVTSVMYGRQNYSICPHVSVQSNESFCECDDSLEVVQRSCNGRQSCAIEASNNVFSGDPCPNTYKYLEIKYTCINGMYSVHYRKIYFVLFRRSNLSIFIGKVHSNF